MLSAAGKRGYEIVIAEDGEEHRQASSAEPDLILMDLAMPVLDGWEATRRIKAGERTAAIPVIGLSAHAMADDEEKARKVGCDDFDTKPVELPRLLGKIEALLHRRPQP
jgi:CheY-like chemotaxis protein